MNRSVTYFGLVLFALNGSPVMASSFTRPIPQPQTAAAELWFALASLLLCVALYAVHRLVKRR